MRSWNERISRFELEQAELDEVANSDPEQFAWYGKSCPCGLAAGECKVHPRARAAQRPPAGSWFAWMFLGGRGTGKTRTGAEWVRWLVETRQAKRIALVGATSADCRDVLIEGPSGLLEVCPPWNKPRYEPSKRRLTWPNGAKAFTYSAEEPNRLRGPQHDAALADELAAWQAPKTWSNLLLGLRLGADPRVAVATTPKNVAIVKEVIASKGTVLTRGTTRDNAMHLAPTFMDQITGIYAGTRLGRQELDGELIEASEAAWFPQFGDRHITPNAKWNPNLPVTLVIDCGVSRCTGAVWMQTYQVNSYKYKAWIFADYYNEGSYSEANAHALIAKSREVCGGRLDKVRLDPASTARTGVGPAAFNEYQRVFGSGIQYWPRHLVTDGLDQIELLLGTPETEADFTVHPDCIHTIDAFRNYERAQAAGHFLDHPKDPQHPFEDLMDSVRGGIRDAFPSGRKVPSNFPRKNVKEFF